MMTECGSPRPSESQVHRARRRTDRVMRAAGGLAAGMLAIAFVLVLTLGIPAFLLIPRLGFSAEITRAQIVGFWIAVSFGWALALFAGGATARRVAGRDLCRGWIGAGCALAFVVAFQLLPEWRWSYRPERGWVPAGLAQTAAGSEVVLCDFSPILWVAMALLGAWIARLGDLCMGRRMASSEQSRAHPDQSVRAEGSRGV